MTITEAQLKSLLENPKARELLEKAAEKVYRVVEGDRVQEQQEAAKTILQEAIAIAIANKPEIESLVKSKGLTVGLTWNAEKNVLDVTLKGFAKTNGEVKATANGNGGKKTPCTVHDKDGALQGSYDSKSAACEALNLHDGADHRCVDRLTRNGYKIS